MFSIVSISPHEGQEVPWRIESPSDQNAGQIPWSGTPGVPSLRRLWTMSLPPGGAENEGFDSMRQDVHCPLCCWGVMSSEPLPESWQLEGESV